LRPLCSTNAPSAVVYEDNTRPSAGGLRTPSLARRVSPGRGLVGCGGARERSRRGRRGSATANSWCRRLCGSSGGRASRWGFGEAVRPVLEERGPSRVDLRPRATDGLARERRRR
jgi:hypothetical protein